MPEIFDPMYHGLVATIGILVTVAAIIPVFAAVWQGWKWLPNRLHVKRITSPADPDLMAVDELQLEAFDATVADAPGEIHHYLEKSQAGRADPSNPHPYLIVMALKHRRVVCGYLTAEYFPNTATIFLWYVHVAKDKLPIAEQRQSGFLDMLAGMLKACDETGIKWQHVITEIESGSTSDHNPKSKMRLFQNVAASLSKRAKRDSVEVYRLPIKYRQPVLRLEHLTDPREHESEQLLLCAPRWGDKHVRTVGKKKFISKELISELLKTLLIQSYVNAFEGSAEYEQYIRKMLEKYEAELGPEIEVTTNYRTI